MGVVVVLLIWFVLFAIPVELLGAAPVPLLAPPVPVPPVLFAPPVVTIAVEVALGISVKGTGTLLAVDITL